MTAVRRRTEPPPVVMARQVTWLTARDIANWAQTDMYQGDKHGHTTPPWSNHICMVVDGVEGEATASVLDWVIEDGQGGFIVRSPGAFAEAYEVLA